MRRVVLAGAVFGAPLLFAAPAFAASSDPVLNLSSTNIVYGQNVTVSGSCPTGYQYGIAGFLASGDYAHHFAQFDLDLKDDGTFSSVLQVKRNAGGDFTPANGPAVAMLYCQSAGGGEVRAEVDFTLSGAPSATPTGTPTKTSSPTTTATPTKTVSPTSTVSGSPTSSASAPGHSGSTTTTTGVGSTGSVTTPVVVETGTVAAASTNGQLLVGGGLVALFTGGGILAVRKRLN